MNPKRVALMVAIVACSAGIAVAQTEWVEHPDNPLIGPGPPGSWDSRGHWLSEVVFDGSIYHMWYEGLEEDVGSRGIGHATSTDGVDWTKDPNPVLVHGDSGEWDDQRVGHLGVVYDGTLFHMWYSGSSHDGTVRVGYATSPDGSVWTKSEHNPVMDVGPPGSWESLGVSSSTVIFDGDVYRLWYVGATLEPTFVARIGYAESPDGIVWNRRSEPVLDVGTASDSFDRRVVAHPEVVFDGNLYHMWYAGDDQDSHRRIGYATSADGIEWAKYPDNPVLERPIYEVDLPNVLIEGSAFRMWFEDDDGSAYWTNLATSDCCVPMNFQQFIPAAAVASGAQGSFYQTDVDLSNAGDQPVEYQLLWLPRGENNEEPMTSDAFTLGAGMSVRYENVLAEIFQLQPNSLGAIGIMSTSPNLMAMSRTYNIPSTEVAGTFGQAMPAVEAFDFIQSGEVRRILFASEHADLRTNVGCQNGNNVLTAVNLELYDAEGNHLDTERMLLDPWSNDQLNQVFDAYRPVIGYVDVSTPMPNRSFYCYGSVLDNVTSDPTTILPQ
jgi:predicted GH43/DUF377 family glycosyl hydrolase